MFDEKAINVRLAEADTEPVRLADLPVCKGCSNKAAELQCSKGRHTYPDQITAEMTRNRISRSGKRTAVKFEQRAYWCDVHQGWHLTSRATS